MRITIADTASRRVKYSVDRIHPMERNESFLRLRQQRDADIDQYCEERERDEGDHSSGESGERSEGQKGAEE